MPSLPYGRGSRKDAADAAISRNESFATRAGVARQFSGAISPYSSQMNRYVLDSSSPSPLPTDGSVHVVPLGFEYASVVVSRFFIPFFTPGTKRGARAALYKQGDAASDQRLVLIEGTDFQVDDAPAGALVAGGERSMPALTISAGTLIYAAFTQPTAGTAHVMRLCSADLVFPGRKVSATGGLSFPKEIGPIGSPGVSILSSLTRFPTFCYTNTEFNGVVW